MTTKRETTMAGTDTIDIPRDNNMELKLGRLAREEISALRGELRAIKEKYDDEDIDFEVITQNVPNSPWAEVSLWCNEATVTAYIKEQIT